MHRYFDGDDWTQRWAPATDVSPKRRWFTRPDIPNRLWVCLLVTLAAGGLVALNLAYSDFLITTGLPGTLGAFILLAIGIANLWAFDVTRRAAAVWPTATVIAQFLVLLLASYIYFSDLRSPIRGRNVGARLLLIVVVIAAIISIGWIIYLIGKVGLKWTRTATAITAIFPLAAFLQFWMQTYYIPQISKPQVDLSVELKPQDKTNPTHLSAAVTVHNRGPVAVNVAGAIMRVTAYLPTTQRTSPHQSCAAEFADQQWCQIADSFDLSGDRIDTDFRRDPTPPVSAQLLYAGDFMAGSSNSLTQGETYTFQREVDIPANIRVARLSVSAVFFNERRIKDKTGCHYLDTNSMVTPVASAAGGHFFCVEYQIEPTNAVDKLIAARQRLRVWLVTDASDARCAGNEYPRIDWAVGTSDYVGDMAARAERNEEAYAANPSCSQADRRNAREFLQANPIGAYADVSAEYAPRDENPPGGKG
jgi:hypothetical protein